MRLLKKLLDLYPTSKGIVSLSIIEQGLTIAIAKYTDDRKPHLVYCAFLRLEEGNPAYLLRQLVQKYQLRSYECHLILNANDYRRINIEAPKVNTDEMSAAIRWQITDLLEYPVDEALIDYYNTPAPTRAIEHTFIDVISSQRTVIAEYAAVCLKSGLSLKVVEIQETSLRNLATLLPENRQGLATLHLQEHSGNIIVQKNADIYLARRLEVGVRALELKTEIDASQPLTAAQNKLMLEIQKSLDYVESYFGLPAIKHLAVIPIPKHTTALLAHLKRNLTGINTHILDISELVPSDTAIDYGTQSYCAAAIGSTLRYCEQAS